MFQIIVSNLTESQTTREIFYFDIYPRNSVSLILGSAVVVFKDAQCKNSFRQKSALQSKPDR